MFCGDMAIQNVIGDAARGATWVSIHNGGGCGWGEVTNGGFGHVLDGSEEAAKRCRNFLPWDVCNGVSRRSWAGNENAMMQIQEEMDREQRLRVTMPTFAKQDLLELMCKEDEVDFDQVLKGCNVATMKRGAKVAYGMVEDAVIGIKEGKIAFVGSARDDVAKKAVAECKNVKNLGGALVTPGLIDCHTHVLYGGDR